MLLIRAIGFIAAGALLWMLYFDRKDSVKPEPRRLLLLAWAWGCGSAILALFLFWFTAMLGFPHGRVNRPGRLLFIVWFSWDRWKRGPNSWWPG